MRALDVDSILHPFTREQFFATVLGRTFVHIPSQNKPLADILSWPDLNSILRNVYPLVSRVRLVNNCQDVSPSDYIKQISLRDGSTKEFLSAPAVAQFMRQGATLIVGSIDRLHNPISMLAEHLEQYFGTYVNVNLYVSYRRVSAFDIHWDDHDVIVLQLSGSKVWNIYGKTTSSLVSNNNYDEPRPSSEPLWSADINEGDVLYIPRGWWHSVLPNDEPAIHLTFGLTPVTGQDFLRWATDQVIDTESLTVDLPPCFEEVTEPTSLDYVRMIQSNMENMLSQATVYRT